MNELSPGLEYRHDFQVTEADTAIAVGSGDVPVLGTPRLIAWAEGTTVAALAPGLPAGSTSVGTRVEIDHLIPSRIGATVSIAARVTSVEQRLVTLEVTAHSGGKVVGRGTVHRAVVDRERFLDRASRS